MTQQRFCVTALITLALISGLSCAKKPETGEDLKVTTLGTVEVTAELVEIPGEIRNDPLYDYAHVMKYRVLTRHRGTLEKALIYVGQYNPAKSRTDAADARAGEIGGTLRQFRVGDIHRLALDVPIDEYYMGGIINKYFGQTDDPIYWAVWTNRVVK